MARLWAGGKPLEDGALQDHAWMGLGFIALHDATGDKKWLDRAALLAETIQARFADGSGRLKMAIADGPLGPIYDSSDGATPSGESSALEFLARLLRRTPSPTMEGSALALRNALSGPLAEQPLLRTDALAASQILDTGESGRRRALAKGTVFAHLGQDALMLKIAPGWHLNAHEPGQDSLIGANIEGAVASWPAGKPFRAGFSAEEITVYEGTLTVPLRDIFGETLDLTLQVCSDQICLEPETVTFRLP